MSIVAVNGGGLVGALAAASLIQRKGIAEVHVFEKRGNIRLEKAASGRSINLIITSRGLFALREVGLEKEALALCVPVEGRMMHDTTGKTNFTPYGIAPNEVNYSVSRSGLNVLLQQKAEERGCKMHYHHDLISMDFETKEATFMVGDTYAAKPTIEKVVKKFDAFFGADGVWSPMRTHICKQLKADGVPDVVDTFRPLGIAYKEVMFPPNPETDKYCMDGKSLHIWPRGPHFLMGLADLKNSFTGTLYLPDGQADLKVPVDDKKPKVPMFKEIQGDSAECRARLNDYITTAYPDVLPMVPDVEAQVNQHAAGSLSTTVCNKWNYKGVAVVFGDAAHGVTPFFGQGMNSGFESFVVLTRLLDRFCGTDDAFTPAGLESAFAEFTKVRPVDTRAIGSMAEENFVEMSYKVGQPEFLRRSAIEKTVEKTFPLKMRSRYYMVTATLIPYSTVQAAGTVLDTFVDDLVAALDKTTDKYEKFVQSSGGQKKENSEEGEDVFPADSPLAGLQKDFILSCIDEHVTPFIKQHGIELEQPLKAFYPSTTTSTSS